MASTSDGPDMGDSGRQRLQSVMSSLEAADFERFDPPADLWGRISVSVAPACPPGMVVEYWIDADDVVFWSGAGWVGLPRDNDAPELVDLAPGRTLWSHFDGDEVCDLWRALVSRVRSQRAAATVPLRCDAPEVRRWFEMTITPGDDGTVRFRSVLVFDEPRPTVPFLDLKTERDSVAPDLGVQLVRAGRRRFTMGGDRRTGAWPPAPRGDRRAVDLPRHLPFVSRLMSAGCRCRRQLATIDVDRPPRCIRTGPAIR